MFAPFSRTPKEVLCAQYKYQKIFQLNIYGPYSPVRMYLRTSIASKRSNSETSPCKRLAYLDIFFGIIFPSTMKSLDPGLMYEWEDRTLYPFDFEADRVEVLEVGFSLVSFCNSSVSHRGSLRLASHPACPNGLSRPAGLPFRGRFLGRGHLSPGLKR